MCHSPPILTVWWDHRDSWRYDHPVKFEVFYNFSLSLSLNDISRASLQTWLWTVSVFHLVQSWYSTDGGGAPIWLTPEISVLLCLQDSKSNCCKAVPLGRDVWRRSGGSFLHVDYIITGPIEEKLQLHLSNTAIQYNTAPSQSNSMCFTFKHR